MEVNALVAEHYPTPPMKFNTTTRKADVFGLQALGRQTTQAKANPKPHVDKKNRGMCIRMFLFVHMQEEGGDKGNELTGKWI